MKAMQDPIADAAADGPQVQPGSPAKETIRLTDSLAAIAAGAAKHPLSSVQAVGRAAAALIEVMCGRAAVGPATNDRRFDDPAWQNNGLYRRLMQAHLAVTHEVHRLAGEL